MAQHSIEPGSPIGLAAAASSRLTGTMRAQGHAQLVVLQARHLTAAEEAIRIVRGQGTVVLNCAAMPEELAQRLLDVVQGGLCAIDGVFEPIGPEVVLLRPASSRMLG